MAQIRKAVPVAELKAVEDMSNEKGWKAQRKLAREQLLQTCGLDARQYTIASDSCCCTLREGSRSLAGDRTESLVATVHSLADRHG